MEEIDFWLVTGYNISFVSLCKNHVLQPYANSGVRIVDLFCMVSVNISWQNTVLSKPSTIIKVGNNIVG